MSGPSGNHTATNEDNPYFLHPSDNPGLVLVSQTLTGEDNYAAWSRAMEIALSAKNKTAFIDGTLPKPSASNETQLKIWMRNNNIVIFWILNTVSEQISASIIYSESAHEIWKELKERFQQSNGLRVYQLRRDLMNLSQGQDTISVYFTKLKTSWEELLNLNSHCSCGRCICGGAKEMDHTMNFLMGLNNSFSQIRDQILRMDPLPPLNQIYSLVIQEERQMNVGFNNLENQSMAFNVRNHNMEPRGFANQLFTRVKEESPFCVHCKGTGHTKDECYMLHGFPLVSIAKSNGTAKRDTLKPVSHSEEIRRTFEKEDPTINAVSAVGEDGGERCKSVSAAVDYYEASLTIRAKMSIVKDILAKLSESNTRLELFKGTCFGRWLDVQSTYGDPLMIHMMLQTQIFPEQASTDELHFRIGCHELRFGREEFCLVTGLRFGQTPALPETWSGDSFRCRIFPHIPFSHSVKGSDLHHIFSSMGFASVSDLDAVRICLLMLLEVGFMGHQPKMVVEDYLLSLVDDLDAWNMYPWGSHVWPSLCKQLRTALPRRRHHEGVRFMNEKVAKYTLTGFVYAFKIWILETFPLAKEFFLRHSDVIPRAIAWQRTNALTWNRCLQFLNVEADERHPLAKLIPTEDEQEAEWWRDSRRFFEGVGGEVSRPPKRSLGSYSPSPSPKRSFRLA